MDVQDLPEKLGTNLILDVRPHIQFEMCRLPHTTNVPYTDLEKTEALERLRGLVKNDVPNNEGNFN